MILAAGLLLLVGLGLLVAGVLTGLTILYWACVAACLVAAVLLVLVRRQMAAERATAERVMADRGEGRAGVRRQPEDRTSDSRIPMAPRPPDRAPDGPTTVLPPAGATAISGGAGEQSAQARDPDVRYAEARRRSAPETAGEPPLEEVEVTDLLLVMDLRDEVLVIDEHPRYHLSGCPHLRGETFPLPIDEARSDGFTPCGTCSPDRHLAQRARERK